MLTYLLRNDKQISGSLNRNINFLNSISLLRDISLRICFCPLSILFIQNRQKKEKENGVGARHCSHRPPFMLLTSQPRVQGLRISMSLSFFAFYQILLYVLGPPPTLVGPRAGIPRGSTYLMFKYLEVINQVENLRSGTPRRMYYYNDLEGQV